MPSPSLVLWVDSAKSNFVAEWQSTLDAADLTLRQGDNLGIELHWVKRVSTTGSIMDEVEWPASANITMAVGRLDAPPTAGTFALSYASETTSELPYNATAQQVEDALNLLTGISTDGGVTVTKIATTYRIVWDEDGVPSSTLTVDSNDLTPTSTVAIGNARTGTSTLRQIYQIHIKQSPVAVCTEWENQTEASVSIEQTHIPAYSGDYRVWRMTIEPAPKSGSFRIGKTVNSTVVWSTPIIATSIGAGTLETALGMSVTQVAPYKFDIFQTQLTGDITNVTALQADDSGIISFSAKYGVLNLNTLDLELLLGGAASAKAKIEIEVEVNGARQTIVQKEITIVNDLIDTDAYELVEWGDVIPADSVVRFDTSQALTNPQKLQARTNIGAISLNEVGDITDTTDDHESRILTLETTTLTSNQKAAVAGASTPSGSNVLISTSALTSALAGYSPTGHSHTIADVTGLQTALNGKASTTHTHAIEDITDLATELSDLSLELTGKANTSHTHTLLNITDWASTYTSINNAIAEKADEIHTHAVSDISGLQTAINGINSDISGLDSRVVSLENTLYVTEAPIDGLSYARVDGNWTNSPTFDSIIFGDLSEQTSAAVPATGGSFSGRVGINGPVPTNANYALGVFDGHIVTTNGYGVAFGDGTTQITAGIPLTGGTATGKVNFTSVSGAAGLNIGIGGTSTSSTTAGDMWISTGGVLINYRDGNGTWRSLAALNNGNTFTANQVIAAATTGALLRVTQTGTGNALVVEDTNNPDTTPFVIDAHGRVGVGITPDATAAITVDSAGIKFGANATVQSVSAVVTATGTYNREIPITIDGVNYRISCRQV